MEDELVGILGKLVEFVENASPVIWEIAQRQVLVNIVQTSAWAIVLAIICGVLIYFTHRAFRLAMDGDDDFVGPAFAGAIFVTALGAASIFLLLDVVGYLINPTYYASENILSMVR